MNKIKIITDSTCDLTDELINKNDIEVLPLSVYIGDEMYYDRQDMTTHEMFKKMHETGHFPRTSQITPQRFYDCFKKYLDEGYQVFAVIISSKMSGTYQSAVVAKNMLGSDDIRVVDSLNVTSGLGLLALKACRLRDKGLDLDRIESEINNTVPHVKAALAFESLEHLVKGGRLSKTVGTIGNILGINLILTVKDGEMAVMGKVRGTKKAVKTIFNDMESNGVKPGEDVILLQVEDEEIKNPLKQLLNDNNYKFYECEVGCVVGTHSGPGACGIFYIENY